MRMMILLCIIAVAFKYESVNGKLLQILKGDRAEILPPAECSAVQEAALNHRLIDDTTRLVASFSRNHGWRPAPQFSDRMNQSASVVISPTNMNDKGLYEFSCSQESVQLDVVPVFAVNVSVNETARLPCDAETNVKSVQSVRWEKHGKPVLQCSLENSERGEGCEDSRVSVSSDWLRTGDLSLTIERAQPGDDGVYFCYVVTDRSKKRGTPEATRLTVLQEPPKPHAAAPSGPPNLQRCDCFRTIIQAVVLTVTVLIGGALCVFLGWKLRPTQHEEARTEERKMIDIRRV